MNAQKLSELQLGEQNGREKSVSSEFKLRTNSKNVTETQIKIVPECLILKTTGNCVEIEICAFSVVLRILSSSCRSLNFTEVRFCQEGFPKYQDKTRQNPVKWERNI